jgi:hypothetical protein
MQVLRVQGLQPNRHQEGQALGDQEQA